MKKLYAILHVDYEDTKIVAICKDPATAKTLREEARKLKPYQNDGKLPKLVIQEIPVNTITPIVNYSGFYYWCEFPEVMKES